MSRLVSTFSCCVVSLIFAKFASPMAVAQVSEDRSLSTTVTRNNRDFTITNGSRAGNNLFHSFQEFSIPKGGSAYFNNSTDIVNIINRVTGGKISDIDGLIRANGNANLFLINPNGIVFGNNAKLDIGGSFLGTTADSLEFTNGEIFSAVNTQTPLLSINVPLGLQFGSNPGSIVNRSAVTDDKGNTVGLQVDAGKTLALLGGSINVEGGNLTASGGKVKLGSVAEDATVSFTSQDKGWNFDYQKVANFENILISQAAIVKTDGESGGEIELIGKDITVTGNSQLLSQTQGDIDGGNIFVKGDSILLDGDNAVSINVLKGKGNAGSIRFEAKNLITTRGENRISSHTSDTGNAGEINFTANTIRVESGTWMNSDNQTGSGNGGEITLKADSLLFEGGYVSARTDSEGDAGTINFLAKDILVQGNGFDTTTSSKKTGGALNIIGDNIIIRQSGLGSNTEGEGNAGTTNIKAKTILIEQNGIGSDSFGSGKGGTINITGSDITICQNGFGLSAKDKGDGGELNISGTDILIYQNGIGVDSFSDGNAGNINISGENVRFFQTGMGVKTFGSGNGGEIKITGENLEFEQSGFGSDTYSTGNGGQITIDGSQVSFINFGIGAKSKEGATGNAGNIVFRADKLLLDNGEIATQAELNSSGKAGQIDIIATNAELRNEFRINSLSQGTGDAGKINFQADSLTLNNQSSITAATTAGTGNAGNIEINVNKLQLDNSRITAFSESEAAAGSIRIEADSLEVNNNAEVSVSSTGTGDGGNIKLKADFIRLNNQGKLIAETASGNGGNINLASDKLLLLRNNSLISAQAGGNGNGGNININSPVIVPLENSDIIANAQSGDGGNIQITTEGIYGSKFSEKLTEFSDITASSEFGVDGTVRINNGNINPNSNLINLPSEVLDSQQQINANCNASSENKFIAIGRGGLPNNPTHSLRGQTLWSDLRTNINRKVEVSESSVTNNKTEIIEATGFQVNNQGEVYLVASSAKENQFLSTQNSNPCAN